MRNKNIFILAAVAIFATACIFYFYFSLNLKFVISKDPEDWAKFGDYYGGVLNPILSFLTIYLLIKSTDLQMQANDSLKDELKENKRNEKIKNFESLFFNMLDRQNNSLPLIFVEWQSGGVNEKIVGVDVFSKLEEIVFDLIEKDISSEGICEQIEIFDSHELLYSQFRCFYLSVNFISEYLSDEEGFSKSERAKYYKALINFTDYLQIKIIAMFLQFMSGKYGNVESVKSNKEFEEVFVNCGLSFNIYKK